MKMKEVFTGMDSDKIECKSLNGVYCDIANLLGVYYIRRSEDNKSISRSTFLPTNLLRIKSSVNTTDTTQNNLQQNTVTVKNGSEK